LTMHKEFWLLLTGASIALVSSAVTALLEHFLALRTQRIKRERDATERRRSVLREVLLGETGPASQLPIAALPDEHLEELAHLAVKHIRKQRRATGTPASEKQDKAFLGAPVRQRHRYGNKKWSGGSSKGIRTFGDDGQVVAERIYASINVDNLSVLITLHIHDFRRAGVQQRHDAKAAHILECLLLIDGQPNHYHVP
jgi:hypothetical protein